MNEQTLAYVKYVLSTNKISKGYEINALVAYADYLRERQQFIENQDTVISEFEPIFSHNQNR